ncbi:hypothetical protein DEU56DRAFT_769437 [Suillus clintonianus]|uniref:uncharacterized protein n=1 Tax=Suillus clintonianus TaxID=1904413 RepID=UPI001B85C943|nr:uncharacterized protein DEU56DRAFT_769437 [Suillus clintonianus]KAG2154621.1 hypothetical protein DEU56DRAFT_769437 [Suillus clintonianus]
MSALKFAVSALNREKPHSSVTDWIDILTSPSYDDEAYDGIPELVDSIALQPTGTSEASRAIRKKLKHGDTHHRYRALVILKALVDNGAQKFQTTFADGNLTDAIKHLAADPMTDQKVKKKLIEVLASWHKQFKDDPSMSVVAGLYRQCRTADRRSQGYSNSADPLSHGPSSDYERKMKEKDEKELSKQRAKRAKQEAKQKARQAEEDARKKDRPRRAPFNFEVEKPQILTTIANASQASSNLVNAIMLVNGEKESVVSNERVQECLGKARSVRKPIVRYIQLVENEEMIGALIETNERIITALQMYVNLSAPDQKTPLDPTASVQAAMAATHLTPNSTGELSTQQRAAVEQYKQQLHDYDEQESGRNYIHEDLQDLSFGSLGNEEGKLPPPMRPTAHRTISPDSEWDQGRGSLSDFSDYESEEEERPRYDAHPHATSSSSRQSERIVDDEDPFADPFAD